jgi:hypothetical protein
MVSPVARIVSPLLRHHDPLTEAMSYRGKALPQLLLRQSLSLRERVRLREVCNAADCPSPPPNELGFTHIFLPPGGGRSGWGKSLVSPRRCSPPPPPSPVEGEGAKPPTAKALRQHVCRTVLGRMQLGGGERWTGGSGISPCSANVGKDVGKTRPKGRRRKSAGGCDG